MLTSAGRLLLDAIAGGELVVGEDVLSIVLPRTLRRPIKLDRAVVAGVIVDDDPARNGDERLRFSVDRDATYLYSSIGGSVLPLLSPEPTVPNLAIVFDQPLEFSEPRRRILSRLDFSPLQPLQPSSPAAGVLLRVADPARASRQLARWSHPERVRGALGSTPSLRRPDHLPCSVRALRRPLPREYVRRSARWSSLPLIGVVFASVFASSRASLSLDREALLLVALILLLSGGVLDTRLRYQERGGVARLASVGLVGAGLLIAITITALSTTHS